MHDIIHTEKIREPVLAGCTGNKSRFLLNEISIGFNAEGAAMQLIIECLDKKIFSVLSGMLMCATLPDDDISPVSQFNYQTMPQSQTITITGCLTAGVSALALRNLISRPLEAEMLRRLNLACKQSPVPSLVSSCSYYTSHQYKKSLEGNETTQVTERTPLIQTYGKF